MDSARLDQARAYAVAGGGSGVIVRHGRVVMRWGDQQQTYDLKSSTKAIGVTAVGLALMDGKFGSLHEPAAQHHPAFGVPPKTNEGTGWLEQITLFQLAAHTAGFDNNGGYTELLFEPGTKWSYSDGAPNWLAECVTLAYGRDLQELMFERVFSPIGIGRADLRWRANAYRPREIDGVARREFGSGIHANVDAMARIGHLYLCEGRWNDVQIISSWFDDAVRIVPPEVRGLPVVKPEEFGNASDHHGLLWWNNADGTMKNVPRDAYWSWGLYDSLIVVIPALDIVVARAGKSLSGRRNPHYAPIEPFLSPIGESSSLPAKWMSEDGRTCHLVFSGDDCFSCDGSDSSSAHAPMRNIMPWSNPIGIPLDRVAGDRRRRLSGHAGRDRGDHQGDGVPGARGESRRLPVAPGDLSREHLLRVGGRSVANVHRQEGAGWSLHDNRHL